MALKIKESRMEFCEISHNVNTSTVVNKGKITARQIVMIIELTKIRLRCRLSIIQVSTLKHDIIDMTPAISHKKVS